MKRIVPVFIFLALGIALHAERVANVCGEVTYYAPDTQTPAEAKQTAIQQARLKAIADEFGTLVAQTNTTAMHTVNGRTDLQFNSFSENEVLGVWLKDTREPEVKVSYEEETMIVKAKVCGKARELKRALTEMQVRVMSRGIETTQFRNNDRIAVTFQAAANGYVAIFIRDDNNSIVNVMLPYENGDGTAREVKSNHEYTFLSTADPEYPYAEETILVTDRQVEHNTLFVVFSQKKFSVPLSKRGQFVPELEDKKFQQWLHNLRVYENTVQVVEEVLTIQR